MKSRIEREFLTVRKMIELYCHLNHNPIKLCEECAYLINYADKKLSKCPFSDNKPACNQCTVHCYRHEERNRIKEIMRFSGPRMIYRHPYLAIMHIIDKKMKTNINKLSELSLLLKNNTDTTKDS